MSTCSIQGEHGPLRASFFATLVNSYKAVVTLHETPLLDSWSRARAWKCGALCSIEYTPRRWLPDVLEHTLQLYT